MWSNLNESFTAISGHISTIKQSFGAEADSEAKEPKWRQMETELDLTRSEMARHKRLAQRYLWRLSRAEDRLQQWSSGSGQQLLQDIDLAADDEQTPDDGQEDDATEDLTSWAVRITALEDELTKVSADRQHWRALASENCQNEQLLETRNQQIQQLDAECRHWRQQSVNNSQTCLRLENQLQELDAEHELATNKVIQIRDQLQKDNADLNRQVSQLRQQIDGQKAPKPESRPEESVDSIPRVELKREEPEGAPLADSEDRQTSGGTDGDLKQVLASVQLLSRQNEALEELAREREKRIKALEEDIERWKGVVDIREQEIQKWRQKAEEVSAQLADNALTTGADSQRLSHELSRLREHLVSVEDNYTQELVLAEERERQLRERLEASDVQIMAMRAQVDVMKHDEELRSVATERDIARNQLSACEDKMEEYSTSVANLQLVIEQIQKENERKLVFAQNRHKAEMDSSDRRTQEALDRLRQQERRYADTVEALGAAGRLAESLDLKEQTICGLKADGVAKDAEVARLRREIEALNAGAEGKVDKQIIKSLVIGYFTAPEDKRHEVERLLARFLDFNQHEMDRTGIQLGRRRSQSGQSVDSLSQKFVQFLENESKPMSTSSDTRTAVKTSKDIAKDLSKSLIQSTQRTNPFLTSMSAPSLGSRHSSANSSADNLNQLLITAPSLSPFSPVLVSTPDPSSADRK